MDGAKSVLALLSLSFFCLDIYDFFSTPPPISSNSLVFAHPLNRTNNLNHTFPARRLIQNQTALLNHTQISSLNQTQNDTILIEFAALVSYRGASMSVKELVEKQFPGINVTFSQHHPDRAKYIVTKLITVAQVLVIMIVMAGYHIFFYFKMQIPSWYHPLAARKFAAVAIPWLLGCIAINYLQNTEDFLVFFNHELVFSKQFVGRFPKASEMKEIIRSRLAS